MTRQRYDATGLRELWDEVTRTYTAWDESGAQTEQRPFTETENAEADFLANSAAVERAQAEFARASALNSAPEELAALQAAILAAEGIADGDPWRQPQGAHDAYPLGALVSHNDKNWESTVAANVWEPGVSGWREVVASGCPEFVQPTGGHDAYNIGDCVTFEGSRYISLIDANVWTPTAYPAGWELQI